MWQSDRTHVKNEASTVCTAMGGGYKFSLPELLAADAGLPVDSPLLSTWSFAVLNTTMAFVCLAIAIACTSLTTIAYFITIVTTPRLTAESPLLVPRVGYLASIAAVHALILSSAKITAMMHKLLETKPVVENGVAWSTAGFYVLTWLATVLMCVMVTLSVVLAFMIRPSTSSRLRELDKKGSGYSYVR
jgi:magnesium-transporting ATPase (P-type)